MSFPHGKDWRHFAEKAAEETDSKELMKHVSRLLQALGEDPGHAPPQPALADHARGSELCSRFHGPVKEKDKAREILSHAHKPLGPGEGIMHFLLSAIAATGAQFGNLQIFDPVRGVLKIVAQYGFEREFLAHFASVTVGDSSACGAALQQQSRIIVEDVASHPIFRGTDSGQVMLRAHAASVQSTPLFGYAGNFLGVVSTHADRPRSFSAQELCSLDALVAEFIGKSELAEEAEPPRS